MIKNLLKWRLFKGIAIVVLVAFLGMIPAQSGYAQTFMPAPGQMVHGTAAFTPTLMKGLRVDVTNPFNLYFLMSDGEKALSGDARQQEYEKLIKYFMASLVIPNHDMWVNLSPKESSRIIPENFSMTEMGRDLLAQDYLLKQFTASLMYPEDDLGKEFWRQVYQKAYQEYGTTDIPVDTFNKVWIKVDRADIYQKNDTAYVVKSNLKVMLEQDLVAAQGSDGPLQGVVTAEESSGPRKMASDIVRNVIIPVIEKEVNEGGNFATVRQAYHAMILATWFKKTLKDSLLGQVYADQSKVAGIAINDPQAKDRIYQQYLAAYKTGVFNYIKEEYDSISQETLPRKYFAGGLQPLSENGTTEFATAHPALAEMAMRQDPSQGVVSVNLIRSDTREGFQGKAPVESVSLADQNALAKQNRAEKRKIDLQKDRERRDKAVNELEQSKKVFEKQRKDVQRAMATAKAELARAKSKVDRLEGYSKVHTQKRFELGLYSRMKAALRIAVSVVGLAFAAVGCTATAQDNTGPLLLAPTPAPLIEDADRTGEPLQAPAAFRQVQGVESGVLINRLTGVRTEVKNFSLEGYTQISEDRTLQVAEQRGAGAQKETIFVSRTIKAGSYVVLGSAAGNKFPSNIRPDNDGNIILKILEPTGKIITMNVPVVSPASAALAAAVVGGTGSKAVNQYAIDTRKAERDRNLATRQGIQEDIRLAQERARLNYEGLQTLAGKIAIESKYNVQLPEVPVDQQIAWLEKQIELDKRVLAGDIERVALPVNGGVVIGPPSFGSFGVSMFGGAYSPSAIIVPNYPGKDLADPALTIANFAKGGGGAMTMYAGPVVLVDWFLKNKAALDEKRGKGQSKAVNLQRTPLQKVLSTFLDVVPVSSFNQNGTPIQTDVMRIGILKNIEVGLGKIGLMFGDSKARDLFGNPDDYFTWQSPGKIFVAGPYEKFLRGVAAQYEGRQIIIFNEISRARGVVPEKMFARADGKGAAILNDLIAKGGLERVEGGVRLKKNDAGRIIDRSAIPAGERFDRIWNLLHPNTQYVQVDEKENRFKSVPPGTVADPYYDMEVTGWMFVDNGNGTWTAFDGFYNAYTAMNNATAEAVSGIPGVTPNHTIFQPMYSTKGKILLKNFLEAERMGNGPVGLRVAGINMAPIKSVNWIDLLTTQVDDAGVIRFPSGQPKQPIRLTPAQRAHEFGLSERLLSLFTDKFTKPLEWLGDNRVSKKIEEYDKGTSKEYKGRPTSDHLPPGFGNWEDKVDDRFLPGKRVRDLEREIQNTEYVGAVYRLDGNKPDLIEDKGSADKTFPKESWVDTFYIIHGKAALPANATVEGGMLRVRLSDGRKIPPLRPGTLVKIEDSKIAGIFRPNVKMMHKWIDGAPAEREKVQRWIESLTDHTGFLVDPRGNEENPVVTLVDTVQDAENFVPLKFVSTKPDNVTQRSDGQYDWAGYSKPVSADAMVKVENGKVVAIFVPGVKMIEARNARLAAEEKALEAGAREIGVEVNGEPGRFIPTVYTRDNGLDGKPSTFLISDALREQYKMERESKLVDAVASNHLRVVSGVDEQTGKVYWEPQITLAQQPVKAGFSPAETAPTMTEFLTKNVMASFLRDGVIAKSEFAFNDRDGRGRFPEGQEIRGVLKARGILRDVPGGLQLESRENLEKIVRDSKMSFQDILLDTVRGVFKGGQRGAFSEQDAVRKIWGVLHQGQFIPLKDLQNPDTIARLRAEATEIIDLEADQGATVAHRVPVLRDDKPGYERVPVAEMAGYLKNNGLVIKGDGSFGFRPVTDLTKPGAFDPSIQQVLKIGMDGRTAGYVVPVWNNDERLQNYHEVSLADLESFTHNNGVVVGKDKKHVGFVSVADPANIPVSRALVKEFLIINPKTGDTDERMLWDLENLKWVRVHAPAPGPTKSGERAMALSRWVASGILAALIGLSSLGAGAAETPEDISAYVAKHALVITRDGEAGFILNPDQGNPKVDLGSVAKQVLAIDPDGKTIGEWVRMYGGKYALWKTGVETEQNRTKYYQIFSQRANGVTTGPVKVEHATFDQVMAHLDEIRPGVDQIIKVRQMEGAWPGEMETVQSISTLPNIKPDKVKVWNRIDARNGYVTTLTNLTERIATTRTQNSFTTADGKNVTVIETRKINGAIESVSAVLTPEYVSQSAFGNSEIFAWLMKNEFFREKEGARGFPRDFKDVPAEKMTALETAYPGQHKQILSVLQQVINKNQSVKFGDMHVQLFGTAYSNGTPVTGKAIVGSVLDAERKIYGFTARRGANDVTEYSVDQSKVIGYAVTSKNFTISESTKAALGLAGRNIKIAEELDSNRVLQRLFIIDEDSKEEAGTIDFLPQYKQKGNYFIAAVRLKTGELVSSFVQATPNAGGTSELSLKKGISSASDQEKIGLQKFLDEVVPAELSGKAKGVIDQIVKESGITGEVRIVRSLARNTDDGDNVFFRVEGDALSRPIGYQSVPDVSLASFMVSTEFVGATPTLAYEHSPLGEIFQHVTTPKVFSRAELVRKLGLDKIKDLKDHQGNGTQAYLNFDEYQEITKYHMVNGVNDESFRDPGQVRYVAARGDPLNMNVFEVEEGGTKVRIPTYDDMDSLATGRSVTARSGEVAGMPGQGFVTLVTKWKSHNLSDNANIYEASYVHNAEGVNNYPHDILGFSPGSEVDFQDYGDLAFRVFAHKGTPLMIQSTDISINPFRDKTSVAKNQSTFVMKFMKRDGVVYRLAQEQNIPGATQKKNLQSTLFANNHPIAIKLGDDIISLSVFRRSQGDVLRDGILGVEGRASGFQHLGAGYMAEIPGRDTKVDVVPLFKEMETTDTTSDTVIVQRVDPLQLRKLMGSDDSGALYTNWLTDNVLQPRNLGLAGLGLLALSLLGLGKSRRKRGNLNAPKFKESARFLRKGSGRKNISRKPGRRGESAMQASQEKVQTESAMANELAKKWNIFLATNRALVVKVFEPTVFQKDLLAIGAIESGSLKGSILDPRNKDGIWQEVSPTDVRLKPNSKTDEKTIRAIATDDNDFKRIWAMLEQARGPEGFKAAAIGKLTSMLNPDDGFFSADEVADLADLLKKGTISFDTLKEDPINDRAPFPGTFDIRELTGNKGTDSPTILALRYALENHWLEPDEMAALMDEVRVNEKRELEVGTRWTQLFGMVQEAVFQKAVNSDNDKDLEKTFPAPEVRMYRALLKKGYTDIRDYVRDAARKNGASTKQRVERYLREKILEPMAVQIRSEIPGLGDTMSDMRTEPLNNALIGEFFRFAMMNPNVLPDAEKRDITVVGGKEVITFNDSSIFDVAYNPNTTMRYSEAGTFREKVISHLLFMPPSETKGISMGSIGATYPMSIFMTRFLIRKLQAAEKDFGNDAAKLKEAKEKILKNFANHTRFWKSVFGTNNWSTLFGQRVLGIYKRITEPGGVQPDLRLKDILYDEYEYYFFERLQADEDRSRQQAHGDGLDVYETLMKEVMDNDSTLESRLKVAEGLLAPGAAMTKAANGEGDPVRKKTYLGQVETWRKEVDGLLRKTKANWTDEDRMLAAAISSDSIFWQIAGIPNDASGNKALEGLVHGQYTQLMNPLIKKTEQYRLERNSYAYFANEMTGPAKGVFHLNFFRKMVPKFILAPVSVWLSRSWFGPKLGTMGFKKGEFNETVPAGDLAKKMNQGQDVKGDPIKFLNQRLQDRNLYQAAGMTDEIVEKAKKLAGIDPADKKLNSRQVERFNRRLIEARYTETPRSLDFVDKDGKWTYRIQSSLYNFFGIKSKFLRGAIVAARAVLTPIAIYAIIVGAPGLGIFIFSAAWLLLPLLFGKVSVASEKPFWLSLWALGTANVALFASVLFGKITLMTLMSMGTFATLGLLALLIPVTIMTGYHVISFIKGHRTYQNRLWSPYWKFRTTGLGSWLMFWPIKNFPKWMGPLSKINYSGSFFGKVFAEVIGVQRTRGPILPAGLLVQDDFIENLHRANVRNTLVGADERKALEASATFIANYSDEILKKKAGAEWDALVAAAIAYEEALEEINNVPEKDRKDYSKISDAAKAKLVAKKRPFVMISPREPKGREFLYGYFQSIVLKKPVDDSFATLQAVSTHEQTNVEVMSNPLENYGRLGTHNIAGLREFMPTLRADFRLYLAGLGLTKKEIDKKEAILVEAANMGDFPFTRGNLVNRAGKLTKEEKEWVEEHLKQAKDNNKIAETSLLGFSLRTNPGMRDNMITGLLAEEDGVAKYKDLCDILRDMEETDDVTSRFQQWAAARLAGLTPEQAKAEAEVIRVAADAVVAFLNQFLPNSISVLQDMATDVLNVHLAAANSYADFKYKTQALAAFRKYGSLLEAFEKIGDDEAEFSHFKNNFRFYQKSAKLKTVGIPQLGLIWSSANEFRLINPKQEVPVEKQEDFNSGEINIADYKYVSMGLAAILKMKNDPLRKKFEEMLDAASQDPDSGIKFVKTKDGARSVVFCKEMRHAAKLFLRFRNENYADILGLPNGNADVKLLSDLYEMMQYVEESGRAEALIPVYDPRYDNLTPMNKNGQMNINLWMFHGRSWNMDAGVRTYPGQSLYRLTYAALVGQNPEIAVVNPAFRIWASSNNAFPGARRYKVAQETFTQDLQRSREFLGTFYGKAGVDTKVGNSIFDTPGEDSAGFIIGKAEYPYLIGTQEDWMGWEWQRPALHLESIGGFTEPRYTSNVTRYYMDTGLFELNLNSNIGYDVKLTNESMFNHYLYATLSTALLILLPALQGFSGFAFLAPALVFVPIAFLAMQAINFHNFHRHWREEGSVLTMLTSGMTDVVEAFSYYVHMIPSFIKTRLQASNETFKFALTVKNMIFGSMERLTRVLTYKRLDLAAATTERLQKVLGWVGGISMVGGVGILALSSLAIILSPNLIWLGPVVFVAGVLALLLGTVVKYRQRTGVVPIKQLQDMGASKDAMKGTLFDPENKNGIWEEVSPTDVRLKLGSVIKEDDVRKAAGNNFDKIWPLLKSLAEGRTTVPLSIPFEGVFGIAGIAGWLVGLFFTTSLGPLVTIPYLLASIAILTGSNVYDTFTTRVKVKKIVNGKEIELTKLRISGQNQWAMFTDHPAALSVFLGALLVVAGLSLAPAFAVPMVGYAIHWFLYGTMLVSIYKGAFSNITQAAKFTGKDAVRYTKDVLAERKYRKEFKHNPPIIVPGAPGATPPAAPLNPAGSPSNSSGSGPSASPSVLPVVNSVTPPATPSTNLPGNPPTGKQVVPAPSPVGPVVSMPPVATNPQPVAAAPARASAALALALAFSPASGSTPDRAPEKPLATQTSSVDPKLAAAQADAERQVRDAQRRLEALEKQLEKLDEAIAALEKKQREASAPQEEPLVVSENKGPDVASTPMSANPQSVITEPVSEDRAAEILRVEKERIPILRQKQKDRIDELTDKKTRLYETRNSTPEIQTAYRQVSSQLRGMEKRAQKVRTIVGETPVGGETPVEEWLVRVKAEIIEKQNKIKSDKIKNGMATVEDLDRLAKLRKDRSYIMREARAVNLEEVGRVIDAVRAVDDPQDLAAIGKDNMVEALVASHVGAGDGIRFFAGLTKTQRVAALKIALTQVKVQNALLVGPPQADGGGSLVKKLSDVLAEVSKPVGGIDFNDEHLVINIEMDKNGVPLAARFQDPRIINIPGLKPVIRSIQPLDASNIPALFELVSSR